MQGWTGWRDEERERGWRSEGETERKSERAQWQPERKEKIKLYLLVVWLSSLCLQFSKVCVFLLFSQGFCLFVLPWHVRASVFVWWREWLVFISWCYEMSFISNLQIFAHWSLKVFRSDARDAEKTAKVLVVYPVHCSCVIIAPWRMCFQTWTEYKDSLQTWSNKGDCISHSVEWWGKF